jgi:hypothetical protein
MPRPIVAASLLALAALGVQHNQADAAPLSTRGAVVGTMNMTEPVGGCRDCNGARSAKRRGSVEGYRYRPRVQGWERRATLYRPRPMARPSARWDPGFRYGAASWGDTRAWDYYGRF